MLKKAMFFILIVFSFNVLSVYGEEQGLIESVIETQEKAKLIILEVNENIQKTIKRMPKMSEVYDEFQDMQEEAQSIISLTNTMLSSDQTEMFKDIIKENKKYLDDFISRSETLSQKIQKIQKKLLDEL